MKKLLLLSISLLCLIPAVAQNRFDYFKRAPRKQLQAEITQLQLSLDSLQQKFDSLERDYYFQDSLLLVYMPDTTTIEEVEEVIEYTTEVSDSLLHLWYKNSYSGDIDVLSEYNLDSVKFISNVSDAEMIKRIEAMNSFITLPFNETVKNSCILYAEKMPSRMNKVMGLSQYYFPMFEEVLNKYGLPLELKYMAVIESMLNPVATSRAGARGMWQFMYATARSYKLEINSYVDERLDVEKAMDAAARYLRDAYKIFGDWPLAISSYNCGAGNVSKAIRRAGGSRDFWSIYPFLPRETRGYVPAFVGAMYAMTYYKEYGLEYQDVGMPVQTDTFMINKNLHFKQIHELVGVPMEDLKNLNPQYLHDIIPGANHEYVLKLPYNWTNTFIDIPRDSLYNYKADSLLTEKVVQDVKNAGKNPGRIAYRVKSGDYLGKIAQKYRVSVTQIKRWNNLRSNNIRVGQILYIYGASPSAQATASSSSSSSSSSAAASKGGDTGNGYYIVRSGESLYTIAKKYPGVSAENIKQANGLTSNNIRPGQRLKIPSR